jgi:hypothetical protein
MGSMMKAIVYRKYGPPDVMKPEDVVTPEPKGTRSWCGSRRSR